MERNTIESTMPWVKVNSQFPGRTTMATTTSTAAVTAPNTRLPSATSAMRGRGSQRGDRWVTASEGIAKRGPLAEAAAADEQDAEYDEGEGGAQAGREDRVRGKIATDHLLRHPETDPAGEREWQALETSNGGSGDACHEQCREVRGAHLGIDRREQHSREAGKEAGERPGESAHATGAHPVQFRHAGALHNGPHAQADAVGAQQERERGNDNDGDHGRGDLLAADRRACQTEVDVVGAQHEGGRHPSRRPDHYLGDARDRDQQAQGRDEPHEGRSGARVAEHKAVEQQTDGGPEGEHRDGEAGPGRPAVARR